MSPGIMLESAVRRANLDRKISADLQPGRPGPQLVIGAWGEGCRLKGEKRGLNGGAASQALARELHR